MALRIGICGSAGTGRTTLASMLAQEMGVPLIASKNITSPILTRDGYDYASNIQIERFLSQANRQEEMLQKHLEAEKQESFVADRTTIDLFAYMVAELHDSDPAKITRFYEACKTHSRKYTHVFLCPWSNGKPLKNNHRRTLNPWYQYLIHSIEVATMREWGIKFVELNGEQEDKMKAALAVLRNS